MMKPTALVAVFLLPVLASAGGGAAETRSFVVDLPDGGELSFLLPVEWQVSTWVVGPSMNLRISPEGSGDFVIRLTVFPIASGSPLSTVDGLRTTVVEMGNDQLATALQDQLELVEIRGDQSIGYLYHLTDRNPEKGPGDYREANQGALVIGGYAVSVTILTHSDDSVTVERAKQLLRSAKTSSGG